MDGIRGLSYQQREGHWPKPVRRLLLLNGRDYDQIFLQIMVSMHTEVRGVVLTSGACSRWFIKGRKIDSLDMRIIDGIVIFAGLDATILIFQFRSFEGIPEVILLV